MAYTTNQAVRDKCGFSIDDVLEDTMTRIVDEANKEVDRIISTTCIPSKKTEFSSFLFNALQTHAFNSA